MTLASRTSLGSPPHPAIPRRSPVLASLADASTNVVLCAETVPCGSAADAVRPGRSDGAPPSPVDVKATLAKITWVKLTPRSCITDVVAAGGKVEGVEIPAANTTLAYPRAPDRHRRHQAFADLLASAAGLRSWRRSASRPVGRRPEPVADPGPAAPDCSSRSPGDHGHRARRAPWSRCWPRPIGLTSVRTHQSVVVPAIRLSLITTIATAVAPLPRPPAPPGLAALPAVMAGSGGIRALVTVPWSPRSSAASSLPLAIWPIRSGRSAARRRDWLSPPTSPPYACGAGPALRLAAVLRPRRRGCVLALVPPPALRSPARSGRPHLRLPARRPADDPAPASCPAPRWPGPGARRVSAPRSPSRATSPAARRPPHWPSMSRSRPIRTPPSPSVSSHARS